MGFISQDKVKIHITKEKKVLIKFNFINKNGDLDTNYISIPKGYELKKIETNKEERDILNLTSENKELNEIWRNKDY